LITITESPSEEPKAFGSPSVYSIDEPTDTFQPFSLTLETPAKTSYELPLDTPVKEYKGA
jgi:hypothetical protein